MCGAPSIVPVVGLATMIAAGFIVLPRAKGSRRGLKYPSPGIGCQAAVAVGEARPPIIFAEAYSWNDLICRDWAVGIYNTGERLVSVAEQSLHRLNAASGFVSLDEEPSGQNRAKETVSLATAQSRNEQGN